MVLGILMGTASIVAALWVYADSHERTDAGCVWGVLAFMMPFPIVPLYFIMRLYADRPAGKRKQEQWARERGFFAGPRFASDIEKMKYMEAAERGPGTMFEPAAGLGVNREGYRHFADQRAEALLAQARYGEAWEYLIDLYALAQKDHDVRALDTYRYYLTRLPGGLLRLESWLAEQRLEDEPPPRQHFEREVPF